MRELWGDLHPSLEDAHVVQLVLGVGEDLILTANIVQTLGLKESQAIR